MSQSKNPKSDLSGAILGIEMQINILEEDLESINTDIDHLEAYLHELNSNFDVLKQHGIIVSLAGYKRLLLELGVCSSKLGQLKLHFHKLTRDMDSKLMALEDYQRMYEMEFTRTEQNVLPFIGRNNGN